MTKELKNIIRMVLSAIVLAFAIAGFIQSCTFESRMEQVRKETIEEAVLVSSDESGYTISFGGELHSYTY